MKQETQQTRTAIRTCFGRIIGQTDVVNAIMNPLTHRHGAVYRSLKPNSEEFIHQFTDGFTALYRHTDGRLYHIEIREWGVK